MRRPTDTPMEKTLTELLAAEAEARRIVEEAEKEVKELREAAKKEAQEIAEEARKQEEQESKRVLEEARSQVQMARKEILDQAEEASQHWEQLFQKNLENAVKFIIEEAITIVPDSGK